MKIIYVGLHNTFEFPPTTLPTLLGNWGWDGYGAGKNANRWVR
mgnify:CR=1 FL=1